MVRASRDDGGMHGLGLTHTPARPTTGNNPACPLDTLSLNTRRALFQERHHAFFHVLRAAARIDAAAVDLVGFHRIVGAQHAPHHLPDQRHRHRRGLGRDLLGQRARGRQQFVRRHHLADEAAGERLLRRKYAAGVTPFQRLRDADDARQEPARRGFRHDAALGKHKTEARGLARRCGYPSPAAW